MQLRDQKSNVLCGLQPLFVDGVPTVCVQHLLAIVPQGGLPEPDLPGSLQLPLGVCAAWSPSPTWAFPLPLQVLAEHLLWSLA